MKYLKPMTSIAVVAGAAVFLATGLLRAADPPKEPARLAVSVSPTKVTAGGDAKVTVRIEPKDGVKINRYPKIKLHVPEQDGVVAEARAEIGNDRPPAPDKMDTNYYESVDPLELDLRLAAGLGKGKHELDAKLTYFYCVTASGFCAPARVPVKIPIDVR